jgi:hypothetical protein
LDGGEPLSRVGEWDRSTATLSGTVYNNVYDKVSNRNFDLQGVVDPWTGKLWVIADDGQGQQQYFYLVNDDGATDKIRTYVENGRTVLYKSHLVKFETRNEIDIKQKGAIADGFGIAIFAAAATITGAYAVSGTVAAVTPQAAVLYGTYAAPAANVVNNHVIPMLDESGQAGNASAMVEAAVSKMAFGFEHQARGLASKIGGTHLMDFKGDWKSEFIHTINNAKNEIHFSLDGIEGSFMENVLIPRGNTNWELNTLYQNKEAFERTIFHYGDKTYKGGEVFSAPIK